MINLLRSVYGVDESSVLNNLWSIYVRYWILGCNQSPPMEKNYLFWICCEKLIWHDGCCLNVVFYFPIFSAAMSMRSVLNLFMIYWRYCNKMMMQSIPILSQFWWSLWKLFYEWYCCDKWMMWSVRSVVMKMDRDNCVSSVEWLGVIW